jgi:zinc transport system substrate-binding protein
MITMKKTIIICIGIICSLLLVSSGCIETEKKQGIQIVTSFYPLYYLANEIAGEKATVTMLIPDNVEPHTWEPTASDIISMENADVFIYNGGGFEPWIHDFLSSIQNTDLIIIDTSANIQLQLSSELEEKLKTATELLTNGPFLSLTTTETQTDTPVINTTNICLNLSLASDGDNHQGFYTITIDEDGEYGLIVNKNITYSVFNEEGSMLQAELSIQSPVDYQVISNADIFDLEPGNYQIHVTLSSFDSIQMAFIASPHEEHAEEEHHHGATDPHFWLDPLRAKIQVDNILTGILTADPQNITYYTEQANNLKVRLDNLHDDFTTGLQNRQKNDIITTHEGFNYLAKRYGFTAHSAIGISADEQPSTQDLADLIELIQEHDLSYVFVEPIYSDEYMTTIAQETGAQALVLDGLHGRTGVHAHMDYFQIMQENLRNLQKGLEASS